MVVGLVLLQQGGPSRCPRLDQGVEDRPLAVGVDFAQPGASINRWVASASIISQPRCPVQGPRAGRRRCAAGDRGPAVRWPGLGRGRGLIGSSLLFTLCRGRQSGCFF